MSRDLTPQQRAVLEQCRAAIEDFDRQHAEIVGRVVEYARQRTGVTLGRPDPDSRPDELPSPWWDWTPRRFLRYVDALQRAAGTLGLERFADRDEEFTLRDLVELTREIDLREGCNAMGIFGEADRLAEGPTS
ncbi:hypothetical protein [Streptomyces sp. GbtcB6]|uniref:hypothetical protein n=1 Tax=Streptomyces sp. GbtcB6 TaxID=2824751 RepID=UPI001C2F2C89|nr:hypothetical protein [Streptomyces sp. GbtcB6]